MPGASPSAPRASPALPAWAAAAGPPMASARHPARCHPPPCNTTSSVFHRCLLHASKFRESVRSLYLSMTAMMRWWMQKGPSMGFGKRGVV